jgi:hypothetical protein
MKNKILVAASMLLGSSSLALGCTVHAGVSANAPPPPEPVVQGQAGVQTEWVVQGEPPPPPPPQIEAVPASPGVEYTWIGGYHRWDGHAYAWVRGHYERHPHAGAQWHAAHWEPRGNGHVWVEGNWDGQAAASPPPQQVAAQGQVWVQPQGEVVVEGDPPAPPPPQTEVVPASPGAEFTWVGGYHRYDGANHHYVWVGGRYEHRPHPGAQWKAAHWEPHGRQHVWVEGNWDANANANAKVEDRERAGVAAAPAAGGTHPGYLHALSDLRNARAHLERKGGDKQLKWDERDATGAIDRAIHDIKEAALDDGKSLEDHPAVDAREARGGRLHKALDALRAARGDIDKEEDNAFARGLRGRASHDIDEAIRFTEAGVQAAK